MNTGYYVLKRTTDRQYLWVLHAGNHEPILVSERYTTKASAENGIRSCQINSPIDSRYDRRTSTDSQCYFVLKAANGEIIGRSERYTTQQSRERGIESCKRNGPTTRIVDQTATAASR